jgi:hypothetical protein
MTPEVRLSPSKRSFAYRFAADRMWTIQHFQGFESLVSDEDVSDWTPLLPASSEDGAA